MYGFAEILQSVTFVQLAWVAQRDDSSLLQDQGRTQLLGDGKDTVRTVVVDASVVPISTAAAPGYEFG